MWGFPDLPENIEHPIGYDGDTVFPLQFICQINCRDIAPYDVDKKLPDTGILYFFADLDYYLGYYDCTPGGFSGLWKKESTKVLYYTGSEDNLVPLMFDKGDVDFYIEERELSFASSNQMRNEEHKLLGKPYFMFSEDFESPVNGWDLLFQLDSDESEDFELNFMDVGLLYFIIDKNDLKSRNFDNTRGYLVSC